MFCECVGVLVLGCLKNADARNAVRKTGLKRLVVWCAAGLFADAESRENHAEQIIGGKFSGDFVAGGLCQA